MIKDNYAPLIEEYQLVLTKKICDAINLSLKNKEIINLILWILII